MVYITSYLSYGELELAINDILYLIKPSHKDQEVRQNVIMGFGALISSVRGLRDAKVEPFGSFLYNLYTRKADVDLSVDVPNAMLSQSADVLEDIRRALQNINVPILNYVPESRIPLLTFESKKWNVTCDVTISNHLGQIKSKFLLWISKIDKRFCDMVLLVKEWASAYDINNPKEGTLNSYALCLLVIFHLQTCVPAILPPLKEIYMGNINVHSSLVSTEESRIQHVCDTNIDKFISFRTVNRSTLPQLMVSFFEKFSQLKGMASKHVMSTYTGKWEDRSSCRWMPAHIYNKLLIEDPLQRSDNTARTVRKQHLNKISQVFDNTYHSLCQECPSRDNYKACLLGQRVT